MQHTTTISSLNSERFEVAFNRIHNQLKSIVYRSRSESFVDLVEQGSKQHAILRKYRQDLRQFARLRNSMVHEKVDIGFYIAEPHTRVVEYIEKICIEIETPPYASAITTKPVWTFQVNDLITDVFVAIGKMSYSQFPVYENRKFRGLVTEDGLAKWVAAHIQQNQINFQGITIRDVLNHESHHNVVFVSKDKNIFDVEHCFEEFAENKTKLEAVIVTETGDCDQTPLGIITAWDLIKIEN